MRCTPGHAAFIRKLYRTLDAQSWREFARFHRSTGFTGSNFETLSLEQMTILSNWATRARMEAASPTIER